MQNTLIEKFLNFKKRELLDYSLVFVKIYPADEESLWKNEDNYKAILTSIIDVYVDKYYLRSKENLEKLNIRNYSEDEFKLAYSLAIIKDSYQYKYDDIKINHKKGLYDLTVIIYILINMDKDLNFMDNYSALMIKNVLEKYFMVVNQANAMSKNPFILDMLANKIKDNLRKERKFFQTIDNENSYNLFAHYGDAFFVKYEFHNSLLDKYKENDLQNAYVRFAIEEDNYEVSYELASITLLKELILGKRVDTLLLPIKSSFLKADKNLKLIANLFSNPFIKENIKFSIFYSDYKKNYDKFTVLKDMGFNLVLYMDRNEMILDYSNIKIDLVIYAKDKFIEKNPKFIDFTTKEGITYYIVNKNEYKVENELLKECRED